MIIAFLAFGVFFGASAAGYTLLTGGSILMALAAYSVVGTLGALAAITGLVLVSAGHDTQTDWDEKPNTKGRTAA